MSIESIELLEFAEELLDTFGSEVAFEIVLVKVIMLIFILCNKAFRFRLQHIKIWDLIND